MQKKTCNTLNPSKIGESLFLAVNAILKGLQQYLSFLTDPQKEGKAIT